MSSKSITQNSFQALICVTFTLLLCTQIVFAEGNCIGNDYEQIVASANTVAKQPEVTINFDADTKNIANSNIVFTASAIVDESARPFYLWCASEGEFIGHNGDFSEVILFTPENFESNLVMSVKMGDSLGYIATNTLVFSSPNDDSGEAAPGEEKPQIPPRPEIISIQDDLDSEANHVIKVVISNSKLALSKFASGVEQITEAFNIDFVQAKELVQKTAKGETLTEYSIGLSFKDLSLNSAIFRARLHTNHPFATVLDLDIFLDNDVARFKNIDIGFNQNNLIDVLDDFTLHQISSTASSSGTSHVVFQKQRLDTSSSPVKVEDFIYHMTYTSENQFSIPKPIFESKQNISASASSHYEIEDLKVAASNFNAAYLAFNERSITLASARLAFLQAYSGQKIIVDSASHIKDFDIKVLESAGEEFLALAWIAEDASGSRLLKLSLSPVSELKVQENIIVSAKASNPEIKYHNGDIYLFFKRDGIVHYKKLQLSSALSNDAITAEANWRNLDNWTEQQLMPQLIENKAHFAIDHQARILMSWLENNEIAFFSSATPGEYSGLASTRGTKVIDLELDHRGDAQMLWSKTNGNLFLNTRRINKFKQAAQVTSIAGARTDSEFSYHIDKSGQRFLFYGETNPNDEIDTRLARLKALIAPMVDEVDVKAIDEIPSQRLVRKHPNALVCEAIPAPEELVCGEDGSQYLSVCHAKKAGTQIKNMGACATNAELILEYKAPFRNSSIPTSQVQANNFSYSFFFDLKDFDNNTLLAQQRVFPSVQPLQEITLTGDGITDPANVQFRALNKVCNSKKKILPDTGKHHVAVVFDEQKGWNLYMDGILECSQPYPGSINSTVGIRLGSRMDSSHVDHYINGLISDFKYFKFGLTSEEVAEHYRSVMGKEPQAPSLNKDPLLKLDFDSFIDSTKGDTVFDTSSNKLTFYNQVTPYIKTYRYAVNVIQDEFFGNVGDFDDYASQQFSVLDNGYVQTDENQLSIAAWMKTSNIPRQQNFISTLPLGIYITSDHRAMCRANALSRELVAPEPATDWMHVACVYDENKLKLYVNSELVAEEAMDLNFKEQSLRIQMRGPAKMDDINVYGKALSAEELRQLYLPKVQLIDSLREAAENVVLPLARAHYSFDRILDRDGKKIIADEMFAQDMELDSNISYTSLIEGVRAKAVRFEQSGAVVPNPKYFGMNDRFTINFFVKPNQSSQLFARFLGHGSSSYPSMSVGVMPSNGGLGASAAKDSNTNFANISSSGHISGNWDLVTLVYNRNQWKYYMNGKLVATALSNRSLNIDFNNFNDFPLYLGRVFGTKLGSNEAKFALDELSFYNQVLSDEQISAMGQKHLLSQFPGECGKSDCSDPLPSDDSNEDLTPSNLGKFSLELKAQDFGQGAELHSSAENESLSVTTRRGGAYAFKSFDKDFLTGKQLRVKIKRSYYSGIKSEPILVQLLDGKYDRNTATDFPKGRFRYKGQGVLQTIASLEGSKENTLTQEFLLPVTNLGELKHVTLIFKSLSTGTYTFDVEGIDILDANGKVIAVLDRFSGIADNQYGKDQERDSTQSAELKYFNLELKEHDHMRRNSYGPGVTFSNPSRSAYVSLMINRSGIGQAFAFKSLPTELLKGGKKLQVTWRTDTDSNNYAPFSIELHEGKFSRKNASQFPARSKMFNGPKQVIESVQGTTALRTITQNINAGSINSEYMTLVFKMTDDNQNGTTEMKIYEVLVLDEFENVVLKFSPGGLKKEQSGTNADYATIGQDDFAPAPIVPKSFALKFREYQDGGVTCSGKNCYQQLPNYSIDNYSNTVRVYSDNSSLGSMYLMKTFDKEFLRGKRIKVDWTINTSRYVTNEFIAQIVDGELDPSNDSHFLDYRNRQAYRVLESIGSRASSDNHIIESGVLDFSRSYQDKVTLLFKMRDQSDRYEAEMKINRIEILDEEDRVLAHFKLLNKEPARYSNVDIRYRKTNYNDIGEIAKDEI